MRFVYNRQVIGLKIDRKFLKLEFAEILAELKSDGWETFKFSDGWCSNFCRRYEIGYYSRCRTKAVSLKYRIPRIKKFHRVLVTSCFSSGGDAVSN